VPDFDDLASRRDDIVSDLESVKDETDEKFNNMPDGLQQGDTGQLLEERVNALDEVISTLQDVDCEPDLEDDINDGAPGEDDEKETDKEKEDRVAELKREKAEEIWNEVTEALGSVSCS
jgi:hypothetical protein